jgi:hypothetical protein
MVIQHPATVLVIAGAWNSAILNPTWLLREAFGAPDGAEEPVLMEFAVGASIVPKFTLRGIPFTATPERLIIGAGATDAASLSRCEELASSILGKLPHTPVTAFGENFRFVENAPAPARLGAFAQGTEFADALDFEYRLTSQSLVSTLVTGGAELHLTRSILEGAISFDFNFNYPVRNATEARERMNGTFTRNLDLAKRIWTRLMGEIEEVEAQANENV